MKTMKQKNGQPVRVGEKQVNDFLKKGFEFCSKSEWKSQVRDVKKSTKSTGTDGKVSKTKSKSKMTKSERDAAKNA